MPPLYGSNPNPRDSQDILPMLRDLYSKDPEARYREPYELQSLLWSLGYLYTRGLSEGRAGEFLDGEELLAILDVFGEDGLRAYLVGHLEGLDDAMEGMEEEGR
jgi:hypothetical protein